MENQSIVSEKKPDTIKLKWDKPIIIKYNEINTTSYGELLGGDDYGYGS